MKRLTVMIAIFAAILGVSMVFARARPDGSGSTPGNTPAANGAVGSEAYRFTATDVRTGETIALTNYRGKVVVLNFWATWCPPCRGEIPDLIQLSKDFAGKIVVIGATVNDDEDSTRTFARNNGIKYPLFMSDNTLEAHYGGITGVPTTFIIDKTGKIVKKVVGGRTYDSFADLIEPYLD